mmetsp:Transcript_39220/g.96542  ORF Transcript_39220/g.96542 Transcript_39220/m.96542 type:complete len:225 (+) Transcript_39220:390-1064(+)
MLTHMMASPRLSGTVNDMIRKRSRDACVDCAIASSSSISSASSAATPLRARNIRAPTGGKLLFIIGVCVESRFDDEPSLLNRFLVLAPCSGECFCLPVIELALSEELICVSGAIESLFGSRRFPWSVAEGAGGACLGCGTRSKREPTSASTPPLERGAGGSSLASITPPVCGGEGPLAPAAAAAALSAGGTADLGRSPPRSTGVLQEGQRGHEGLTGARHCQHS